MKDTHCRTGPKSKASKGQKKYKALNVTLPPELWELVEASRKPGEKTSHLVARLLEIGIDEYLGEFVRLLEMGVDEYLGE